MKIALIGLRLTVGTRLVVDTLGAALGRLGHDVLFVGEPHTPPEPMRSVSISGGASYPAMLAQTLSPSYYRTIVDLLEVEAPDLCYFYSVHPANGFLCDEIRRSARRADRRPPVIAAHIHDPLPHPGFAWPLIFGAHFGMARAADHIVAFGHGLARQISRLYRVGKERIIVVPHGASRPPRSQPPTPMPQDRFSFLGRIDAYKGVDVFLAAARLFLERQPDARFYIGGAGSLQPYQQAINALGDAVTVENRELTNDETDRVMQSSWAVVLPYTSGTQSGVIPVAFWNACPVITTRVGALPELVADGTGFMVDPRDPNAIADKMALLWNDPARRAKMGAQAFASYDQWLRWDVIGQQLVAALS